MASNRKIFIINPEFQYRFSFIICSILFIMSLVYPLFVYELINLLQAKIAEIPGDMPISSLSIDFDELLKSTMFLLMLIMLGFICLTFVLCIFISHKIAGPMYKLSNFLRDIRNGGAIHELTFRDGDQFQEVAGELNETLEYLVSRDEDEIEYLSEVSTYIENIALVVPEDKKPVLEEIQRKIEDFKRLHESV